MDITCVEEGISFVFTLSSIFHPNSNCHGFKQAHIFISFWFSNEFLFQNGELTESDLKIGLVAGPIDMEHIYFYFIRIFEN